MGRSVLALALLMACAKKSEPEAYYGDYAQPTYGGYAGGDDDAYDAPAPMAPMAESESYTRADKKRSAPSRGAPPPPPPPPPMQANQPAPPPDVPAEPVPAEQAEARMVHYEGWAALRVANPRDALDAVVAVADAVEGRVERVSGNTAVIRVPVARFDEAWQQVLALGDVQDRSVRADDVTEAFTATELRARTLREVQKRLVELLGKTTQEEEKLRLLAELTRTREELDVIESQLRTLSDLAAMSRISVSVTPREAFSQRGGRPGLDGFGWIAGLSPFRRDAADDHRVSVDVPEGLVTLAPRGPLMAESADGTVLWTQRVDNDPVGTSTFWIDAVEDRLATEFAEPARRQVGAWECLTLQEPGADEAYRWDVCVQAVGRKLLVAQAYYPGPEQVERFAAPIEQALGGAGA
ncbi:MAG: DUF4349 domain-containing protein [Myxococcota bacterium]